MVLASEKLGDQRSRWRDVSAMWWCGGTSGGHERTHRPQHCDDCVAEALISYRRISQGTRVFVCACHVCVCVV